MNTGWREACRRCGQGRRLIAFADSGDFLNAAALGRFEVDAGAGGFERLQAFSDGPDSAGFDEQGQGK